MEPEPLGDSGVSLMHGERVDSTLDLREGMVQHPATGSSMLFLTNKRLILLDTNGGRRNSAFASVQSLNAIEVVVDRRGIGSYIWAGLALVLAGILVAVIDHPVGSIAAAVAVALMGVYLLVDKLMETRKSVLKIKLGSSEFQCELTGSGATSDVYTFVNRVFQVKDGDQKASSSPLTDRLTWF